MTTTHATASKVRSPNMSTRKLYTFTGGIHPDEHKAETTHIPIRTAPIPPNLILPLQQHVGAPAKPIVKVGDRVLKGQVVAEAQGALSVSVHAPTSGYITDISLHAVPHASGMSDLCLLIETDGLDEWVEREGFGATLPSEADFYRSVREAGIAGMGGAGFPTSIKVSAQSAAKIETLLINAAECEPYITADDRILQERSDLLVAGAKLIAHYLKPHEILIGIEDNKPDAIAALIEATRGEAIEIVVIPTKYPSGGEKQLIQIVTGKEVPSGGLPSDLGILCQNVATIIAVYKAITTGEPLINRVTTLVGEAVTDPGNVEVLLGTPIDWLMTQYGYTPQEPERLIMGGPMMGFALPSATVPVVKTTNCLLAPGAKELPLKVDVQACIRCGLCAEACPAELLPQQLYWFSKAKEFEKAEHHHLMDCIECGACSYVCPSNIPLVQHYRYAKGEVRKHKAEHQKSDAARERFEFRQFRLEREQEEKDAKRKARAEAAAKMQAEKEAQNKLAPQDMTVSSHETPADQTSGNPSEQPTAEQPTIEQLQQNRDNALAKVDKLRATLESMADADSAQKEKMQRAIEKNTARAEQAQEALDARQNTDQKVQPVAPVIDIEQLRKNLESAEAKVEKLQATLESMADAEPAQREKMLRALEKNKTRAEQARAALESQSGGAVVAAPLSGGPDKEPSSTPVEQPIDQLEKNLENAQAKIEKLKTQLEEAKLNQPDLVTQLTKAIEKNQMRVRQAKLALDSAQSSRQGKGS